MDNQTKIDIPPARMVAVAACVPAARNPNVMQPAEYRALVESIRRWGFVQPVLVQPAGDGKSFEIVDGHHRVRAATELGVLKVPALVKAGWTPEEVEAVRLATGRIRGRPDLAVAGEIFSGLMAAGFGDVEVVATGFSPDEVRDLMEAAKVGDEATLAGTKVAELDEEPVDAGKGFVLEITFRNRDDMVAARRALKKHAGRGGDLARGLLRALGEV